jgi:G6PDH family F420-dependent oxidoreductase
VVAQKAATMQLLSEGRFTLGVGAGENLNEHAAVAAWPSVDVRHDMLAEALEIMRALFEGGYVNYRGQHYDVQAAKLWEVPDPPVPIGVAVSGPRSCEIAGRYGDAVIAVEPRAELLELFDRAGGAGKPRIGQVPVSYDPDRDKAVARAHEQFRWFGGGWKVNAELPGTAAFEAASQFVRPEDVAEQIACGADVDEFVAKAGQYTDAGFTHVAFVQVGGDSQGAFLDWAEQRLLPALRAG